VGPNPFIGVIYHWIGGLASASISSPSGESSAGPGKIFWIIQGIAAWIVAPMVLALLLVPHLFTILHAAPTASIYYACFWGVMWGLAGSLLASPFATLELPWDICDRARLLYRHSVP